jgi:hypothetical protein
MSIRLDGARGRWSRSKLSMMIMAEAPVGDSARQHCNKESALNTCSALGATGIPFLEITTVPLSTPVDLSGTIKTSDGTDICAMVLASGKFMFSCNPVGIFSLPSLPLEQNGTVKPCTDAAHSTTPRRQQCHA